MNEITRMQENKRITSTINNIYIHIYIYKNKNREEKKRKENKL